MAESEMWTQVMDMLKDPTCVVTLYRSMHQEGENADDGSANFKPGEGRTAVIEIHGGANNVQVLRVKTEDDEDI